jgi:hypothetical protein
MNQFAPELIQPPKRRAQVPTRTLIARFGPQRPSDVRSVQRVRLQAEEDDQSLHVQGQLYRFTTTQAGKAAEQPKPRTRMRIRVGRPAVGRRALSRDGDQRHDQLLVLIDHMSHSDDLPSQCTSIRSLRHLIAAPTVPTVVCAVKGREALSRDV